MDTGTDGDTSGTDAVIGTVVLVKGVTGAAADVKVAGADGKAAAAGV